MYGSRFAQRSGKKLLEQLPQKLLELLPQQPLRSTEDKICKKYKRLLMLSDAEVR